MFFSYLQWYLTQTNPLSWIGVVDETVMLRQAQRKGKCEEKGNCFKSSLPKQATHLSQKCMAGASDTDVADESVGNIFAPKSSTEAEADPRRSASRTRLGSSGATAAPAPFSRHSKEPRRGWKRLLPQRQKQQQPHLQ